MNPAENSKPLLSCSLIHQGPDGGVSQSSILAGDEMQGDVFSKYLSTSWLARPCVSGYMTKWVKWVKKTDTTR